MSNRARLASLIVPILLAGCASSAPPYRAAISAVEAPPSYIVRVDIYERTPAGEETLLFSPRVRPCPGSRMEMTLESGGKTCVVGSRLVPREGKDEITTDVRILEDRHELWSTREVHTTARGAP